jgi:hypothetical protein
MFCNKNKESFFKIVQKDTFEEFFIFTLQNNNKKNTKEQSLQKPSVWIHTVHWVLLHFYIMLNYV